MNVIEARTATKALVQISASMAGLDISNPASGCFTDIVNEVFERRLLQEGRRPEAVGNLLKWVAATLVVAQENGGVEISDDDVNVGKERVCPLYPFD